MNGIFSIPEFCFSGCNSLKEVNIHHGSKYIGYKSFEHCYSLESIHIPSSVRVISDYSFIDCKKLTSIIFEATNSLERIFINSFSGCESLSSLSNFESNKYKCDNNTIYFNNNNNQIHLIYHAINSTETVLIVNCDVICQYSFNYSKNIENISISNNSVSLIESFSFNNCINLKHINFPISLQTIHPNAFNQCNSIECPIIENNSISYIKMIEQSGIKRNTLIKCRLINVSHGIDHQLYRRNILDYRRR